MASSVTVSNSLSVIGGRPSAPSARHDVFPAAVTLAFPSSLFRSLSLSVSSSASWPPVAAASFRKRDSVKRAPVMANASEWEQDVGVKTQEEGTGEGGIDFENEFVELPEGTKLFVGNLPFNLDNQQLGELFEGAGEVLDVNGPTFSLSLKSLLNNTSIQIITDRETGNSRGFGFVTMATVEGAEKGVELYNRHSLEGRLLTVNKAAPRGTRVERPSPVGSSNKIYVGNLPWQADDNSLLQLFSEHGKVLEARVVYDRETGRSRGFGFVTYSSESEVNDAIAALDGTDMEGRPLRVNIAEDRRRGF